MSVFLDSLDFHLFRPDCNPYSSILEEAKKRCLIPSEVKPIFFGLQHPFGWVPDIKAGEIQLVHQHFSWG